jgi:ABC-type transport system substrate-binding protein
MMRKLLFVMMGVIFVFSLTVGGRGMIGAAEPSGTPRYGGILKIGDSRPTTFLGYPQKMVSGYVKRQVAPAIESLFRLDKDGQTVPWLATGWKMDSSAKVITLTLRKGVKFHDGTDFNAEAAKWNLDQAITTKQFGSVLIDSVDVVDPYTIRINLKQRDNTLLGMLGFSYIGMMISPTAFKTKGEDWVIANPVGTGPFRFVSWQKDVKIAFRKFEGYWQKGKPYLDGIENVIVYDKVVGGLSFKAGETDQYIEPNYEDIAGYEKEGYRINRLMGAFASPTAGAIPDSADPNSPFSKLKVRQAVAHAIDTQGMVKAILAGEGVGCTQWMFPGHWAYNPGIKGYPYNPEKAKQLLAEAGYPNGFKTKYTIMAGPAEYQQFGQALAGYLDKIGIQVEIVQLPTAQIQGIWARGGSWDGLHQLFPPPYPDVAAGLRDRFFGDGKNYKEMLAPEDYRQAVSNAVTAADFATKQKWTQEALKLLTDKYALAIPFYHPNRVVIERPFVHGSGSFMVATDSQWTPEDAWLDKK